MPNWSKNTLILSHDDPRLISRVRQTVETLESRDLLRRSESQASHVSTTVPGLLGEFVPEPPEVANSTDMVLDEDGQSWPAWRVWADDNWGTKWDVFSALVTESSDRRITIGFDTAWSPPIPWLHRMAELGFTYTMRFVVDGVQAAGIATNANPSRTDEYKDFDIDSPLFEEVFGMPWRKWYGYPDDDEIDAVDSVD